MITSFKKCGISNTMDMTGDEILFDPNIGANDGMFDSFPNDSENKESFVDFETN